jgi:hypothetical protein
MILLRCHVDSCPSMRESPFNDVRTSQHSGETRLGMCICLRLADSSMLCFSFRYDSNIPKTRYSGSGGNPNKSTLGAAYLPELVSKPYIRSLITNAMVVGARASGRVLLLQPHAEIDSMPLNLFQWNTIFVKLPLLDIF